VEGILHTTSTTLAEFGKQNTGLETFRIQTEEWRNRVSSSQQRQTEATRSLGEHLATKIEAITTMSSRQYDEMIGMLREIQLRSQPPGLDDAPNPAASLSESSTGASEPTTVRLLPQIVPPLNHPSSVSGDDKGSCHEPAKDMNSILGQELADCIDQLCNLASKKPGLVSSQEAESVINDLDYILSVIEGQDKISISTLKRETKRKTLDTGQDSSATPNIKRVRRVLAPSQTIDVGKSVVNPRLGMTRHLTTHQVTTKLYEVQGATITISHCTKRPRLAAGSIPKDGTDADGKDVIEVFRGTVTLHVPDGLHAKRLNISFNQHVNSLEVYMLTPAVSIHSIKPMGSKVFNIAAKGSIQELMELLQGQGGNASLWDCDPEGRSLLNVSAPDLVRII
jgi:hypothetical protein